MVSNDTQSDSDKLVPQHRGSDQLPSAWTWTDCSTCQRHHDTGPDGPPTHTDLTVMTWVLMDHPRTQTTMCLAWKRTCSIGHREVDKFTDCGKILRPTQHKIDRFRDVLPSQSLGLVLKNQNTTKYATYNESQARFGHLLWHPAWKQNGPILK